MAQQPSNGEYHRAHPGYRRAMMVVLVLTALVGIGALAALHLWLSRQGARLSAGDLDGFEHALNQMLAIACFVLASVGAIFSLWLFRLASATRAERRWPPSHMRTSSDVRIRYLTSADSLVTQMRAAAYALTLITVAIFAWGAWLLKSL